MHDYEKIRRAFMYGMSAIAYYKVVRPEIDQMQKVAIDLDLITNLMLKRGDLIPPSVISRTLKNENFNTSLDINGNYHDDNWNFRF